MLSRSGPAQAAFPQLPPLRSAQFAFIGPVTGALFLTPILLRAAKSATFIQVEGKTETNTALSATLVFGAARRSRQSYSALPMPDAAPPGALPELIREPFAPTFSYQFETQIAGVRPPLQVPQNRSFWRGCATMTVVSLTISPAS